MKRLLDLLFFSSVLFGFGRLAHAQDHRPVVAVFGIQIGPRVKLTRAAQDGLVGYLESRLTESGEYQVIPRDQLRERLESEKKRSYRQCFDQSCQIEIGKELAAEKTLSTRIVRLGKHCTVTLTLYDLRKAATDAAATQHGGCTEDGVVTSLDKACEKLFSGGESGGSVSVGGTKPDSSGPQWPPKCKSVKQCFFSAKKFEKRGKDDRALLHAAFAAALSAKTREYVLRQKAETMISRLFWKGRVPGVEAVTSQLSAACDEHSGEPCIAAALVAMYMNSDSACAGFFRRACDGNLQMACTDFAALLSSGKGVEKDEKKAATLAEKACEAGEMEGCLEYARFLLYGAGVKKNRDKAVALLEKACRSDVPVACAWLSYSKASNNQAEEDRKEGAALLRKACDSGALVGCLYLGNVSLRGFGVDKNPEAAGALFRKACDNGYSPACDRLAGLYYRGKGVPADKGKARALLERSCAAGFLSSCPSLGTMQAKGEGGKQELKEAVSNFRKACDGQVPSGCYFLGLSQLKGTNGVEKDPVKAFPNFKKTCDAGFVLSCEWLGYMYASGLGVAKDLAKGKEAYKKACDGGVPTACKLLKELH